MSDWVERELGRHLRPPATPAPDFEATLETASARAGRFSHRRAAGGLAGFAVVVAAVLILRPTHDADPYRIDAALLTSTYWAAPSDALLPDHEFDIYQEIPALPGSTEPIEGTFL